MQPQVETTSPAAQQQPEKPQPESRKAKPEYVIELLSAADQFWTHTDAKGNTTQYPRRCNVCLEPATKVETYTGDSTYRRYLCDADSQPKQPTAFVQAQHEPAREIQYAKDKNDQPRIAVTYRVVNGEKQAYLPGPRLSKKVLGRRNPHMTKRGQWLKSATLTIFKRLFGQRLAIAKSDAAAAGKEFKGLPYEDIAKVGTAATTQALRTVRTLCKARSARARRNQQLSRRINFGLTPGNTNRRAYVG